MPRALLVERERWCEARLCLLAHRSHTYLLMTDKPSKMLLFCNDVVWDGQSHHAAAEMLKESSPGSELWCATNLCTSPLCASRLCKALAAGAAAGR